MKEGVKLSAVIIIISILTLFSLVLIYKPEDNSCKLIEINDSLEFQYVKSGNNLTYSYYNTTTKQSSQKDSGIPIYKKVFKE